MSHPGIGFPGILALLCLSLIVLSSFAAEAASWLELMILVLGFILLGIEIFALPGFGIAGILGILFILFSLFTLVVPTVGPIKFDWDWDQLSVTTLAFMERLGYFIGTLFISLLIILIIARYLTPGLLKRSKLVLEEKESEDIKARQIPAIGEEGIAYSDLRPGGKILINHQIIDAVKKE